MRQQAAAMRERLHVDPTGWHMSGEDLSMLPAVQDAVARDRQLTFEYTRSDGVSALRTVNPLGIVAKGATWYLVAHAINGLRTYRISRMRSVTPLTTTFERPASFDLAAYWQKSTAELEQQQRRYRATLSMEPQAARSIATWCEVAPASLKTDQTPTDWVNVTVHFDNEKHARFSILGFGSRAYVIEPASLQQSIQEDARAILALAASLEPEPKPKATSNPRNRQRK